MSVRWILLALAATLTLGCPAEEGAGPGPAASAPTASDTAPTASTAPSSAAVPSAGAPSSNLPAIDIALVAERTDVYQMLLSGNPMGTNTVEVRHEADGGLVFRETASVPDAGLAQETEMRLDAELAPATFRVQGRIGSPVDIQIAWDGSTIRGHSDFPRAAGLPQGRVELEIEVMPQTVERTSLVYLIPAMELEVGMSHAMQVFNPYDLRLRTQSLRVVEETEVTVPAGTFEVLRVDLDGGEPSQIFWITKDAPRRPVRIQLVGQPWVYELMPEGTPPVAPAVEG